MTTEPTGRPHRPLAVIAIALSALLAGCGVDEISEGVAERVAENQTGEDVHLELGDDGEFSIQTEDGELSMEIDDEGNVQMSGSGNGESFESSGDVPDDFPSSVPLPSSLQVTTGAKITGDDTTWSISGETDAAPMEFVDEFVEGLTANGYTEVGVTDAGPMVQANYEGPHQVVVIAQGNDSTTIVQISVLDNSGG